MADLISISLVSKLLELMPIGALREANSKLGLVPEGTNKNEQITSLVKSLSLGEVESKRPPVRSKDVVLLCMAKSNPIRWKEEQLPDGEKLEEIKRHLKQDVTSIVKEFGAQLVAITPGKASSETRTPASSALKQRWTSRYGTNKHSYSGMRLLYTDTGSPNTSWKEREEIALTLEEYCFEVLREMDCVPIFSSESGRRKVKAPGPTWAVSVYIAFKVM